MLDCANGYQKENQKEVHRVEENHWPKGDAGEKTGAEEEKSTKNCEAQDRPEHCHEENEGPG